MNISAVIFDKDGTLFFFFCTWGFWTGKILARIAGQDGVVLENLAQALKYDVATKKVLPDSLVAAGTPVEISQVIQRFKPDMKVADILSQINKEAETVPQALVTDLKLLIKQLRGQGLKLSVMTNDAERPARMHLEAVDALDLFDHVIGSDSGYGSKPDPTPLIALAAKMDVSASNCVMVGDSPHDLIAGRLANMRTVAVLTGLAERKDLATLADTVLPDISYLANWISSQNA